MHGGQRGKTRAGTATYESPERATRGTGNPYIFAAKVIRTIFGVSSHQVCPSQQCEKQNRSVKLASVYRFRSIEQEVATPICIARTALASGSGNSHQLLLWFGRSHTHTAWLLSSRKTWLGSQRKEDRVRYYYKIITCHASHASVNHRFLHPTPGCGLEGTQ